MTKIKLNDKNEPIAIFTCKYCPVSVELPIETFCGHDRLELECPICGKTNLFVLEMEDKDGKVSN